MHRLRFAIVLACLAGVTFVPMPAAAAPCDSPDNLTRVTGDRECLVAKTFAANSLSAPVLYVVLHGDTSGGGPSDYHYAVAQRLGNAENAVAVALIRPGYFDSAGAKSSGNNFNRTDSYTAENVDDIAGAIKNLKAFYKPSRVVLVAHSGGSAISAVILGRTPHLANAAVLVSCPCDIEAWRSMTGRRPWPNSESPIRYVDRIPTDARVAVLVGSNDTDTPSKLSEEYLAALKGRGIAATLDVLQGATHNGAFRSSHVIDAAQSLAKP